MKISTKVKKINENISALRKNLSEIQETCPHINLTKTSHGSTGNYDPTQDSYWYEFICHDCGKRWSEEQ